MRPCVTLLWIILSLRLLIQDDVYVNRINWRLIHTGSGCLRSRIEYFESESDTMERTYLFLIKHLVKMKM